MPNPALVDATDLTIWANRRDAQGRVPQLIRRLILATTEQLTQVSFRSQEGVQLGGWDGIAVAVEGNTFVSAGLSGWELGTDRDIKGKADDDYSNRCADPEGANPLETTFVFVTPRRWKNKKKWVTEKTAEGFWREVRAYDADDIETWLELAPAVHVWLSGLLGKATDTMIDLYSFWVNWSETTRPYFTADLVIGGREEIAVEIHRWLGQPAGVLTIQSDAQDEVLAFVAASLEKLLPADRDIQFSRSLVVLDAAAWRQVAVTESPLLLIPLFENADVAPAIRNGHHVLIPLGKETAPSINTLKLPRLRREAARQALVTIGFAEDRAAELATLARRSLVSLRRKLSISPELQQPTWVRPEAAHAIIPAMLAGTWNAIREGDQEVLATLAGQAYEAFEHALTRWANESDPPVRRLGNTWFLISKEDAWSLLSRLLTQDDLQKFERVVMEVLAISDPTLVLSPDRRWLGLLMEYNRPHSGLLREGLADTLAIMGARSAVTYLPDGTTSQDHASRIVHRLLQEADGDRWISLSDVLPLLSETAPEVFLAAVDGGLAGDNPVLIDLFMDNNDNISFPISSSPHTGLLWALENVAWHPDYLGRAAILLARLGSC